MPPTHFSRSSIMNKQDQSIYTSMKVCNLLVSAVSLVIGVLIIFFSTQLGIGSSKSTGMKAGTWPWIMGVGILLFSLILFCYTLKNAKVLGDLDVQNEHGEYVNRVSLHLPQNRPVYLVMVVAIVFSVCLKYLGIYISGAILLPILMWLLVDKDSKADKRKILVKIGLIDVCMLVAVYIIFEVGLKVKLPEPIWM